MRFLDLLFLIAKELQGGLKHLACLAIFTSFLLKLGPSYLNSWFRTHGYPAFINYAGSIQLIGAFLHLDVSLPCFVVWLPLHPASKNLMGIRDILKKFLEIDIPVPQLVHTRKEGDGVNEQVTSTKLDITILELQFRDLRALNCWRRARVTHT